MTIISLMLRSLRWAFLLCRAQVRIPIRDAYIGYFAGLSLLLTPFLLGEITVRAAVHRARGGVPIATTVVINLWERFLDLVALGLMTGTLAIVLGLANPWTLGLLAGAALTLSAPVRRLCLQAAMVVARPTADLFDGDRTPDVGRLMESKAWAAALAVSVAA